MTKVSPAATVDTAAEVATPEPAAAAAGGVSVGILKTNGSLTTETSVTISGGSGGTGGAGGAGGGGAGTAGALATTITP